MRKTSFFAIAFVIGAFAVSQSTIINIPADYPSIQQGIYAGSDGDTVLVQPGTYYENINFSGRNIVVASLFLLDNDPANIVNTVINGSQPQHPDTASCVLIVSGEDRAASLVGFTLTGGQGTVWQDIHNHLWYREGGGILIELSSPTIKSNVITANEAVNDSGIQSAGGGGIRAGDGNPLIAGNVISFNSGRYGGGIVMNYATGTITGNAIYYNDGGEDYGGGGFWTYGGGQTQIINNTITDNTSVTDGGGILVWSTSVSARNNIVYGNTDSNGYPQIRLRFGGSAVVSYCDVEGAWQGDGNIDTDPIFRDPDNGDFHLMSVACGDTIDSPCIDSGDPVILDSLLDCSWGLGGSRSDIGAFGGGDTVSVGIPNNIPSVPNQFALPQNHPNPFNAQTNIRFTLPEAGNVRIAVYDLLGRQVKILAEDYMRAGTHTVNFDASDLSSGVYFYRLQAGEMDETKGMVLLK